MINTYNTNDKSLVN